MKPAFSAIVAALIWMAAGPLHAEDQNSEIITVGVDKFLRWHGQPGRTYFVQVSDPNDPLRKWIWAPIIETGNDEDISYEVDGTASKGFFRLKFTDQIPAPNETPESADFDGDGLSNWHEIALSQSDPLAVDTDGDSLPDGWEWLYGLDLLDGTGDNGAQGDPDHDGVINEEEHAHQTDPGTSDTDGDGITDGGELDQNTDPNDPLHKPEAEWFILTGDLEMDVVKSRSRVVTIPAGQSRVIAVLLASEEYPDWTGEESEFNDILTWNILPTGGQALADSIDVNSLHADWENEEQAEFGVHGRFPAHVESSAVFQAPVGSDLSVEVVLSATNVGDNALPSTVMVGLLPARILPDDGQPGKTGDQIASVNGQNGEKHFVSPKKTSEIPDDYVDLKVEGVDKSLFERLLEWEGGEIYPGEPLKCRVKRELPLKEVVKIRAQYDDAEADVMNVWIVWSEPVVQKGTGVFDIGDGWSEHRIPTTVEEGWRFRYAISPLSIITDTEKPSLQGPASKPVPGAGNPHLLIEGVSADSATTKWDVSRQMQTTVRNPNLIAKQLLVAADDTDAFWANQPQALDILLSFPTAAEEGNDDPPIADESGNPYEASTALGLDHSIGEVSSQDAPNVAFFNSWGQDGFGLSVEHEFREFVRLELWDSSREAGKFWFRISEFYPWHFKSKVKYKEPPGQWQNDGSSTDSP